ncbi:GcrA family cell cycle regulator [Humitalea sp. 24SJ18S-53]|uniref:GcrA family cell cycle regulator n=1 Tax=Humitalea sp. 24SJ18S-53 TaxID=3422307 RepID=UPI003D67AD6C
MDWSDEAIETLKALWAEGHSTAEIGRRMGISKNAVVGKAHRLVLPARPSPIRRDGVPRPITSGRPIMAVVPRPAPVAPRASVTRPPASPVQRIMAAAPPPAAPRAVAAPPPVVRAFPRFGGRTCCWPLGEPGTAAFRFCGGDALTGKPYCTEHAAVAYVRTRDRREDAA